MPPKKTRVGLVRGKLWRDRAPGIAVLEAGRLLTTPSPFVRRIEVVRDTRLLDGSPSVRITHAVIETQRLGRGELTITEYRLAAEEKGPSRPTGASGRPLAAVAH